jgi:hypothetical protein
MQRDLIKDLFRNGAVIQVFILNESSLRCQDKKKISVFSKVALFCPVRFIIPRVF